MIHPPSPVHNLDSGPLGLSDVHSALSWMDALERVPDRHCSQKHFDGSRITLSPQSYYVKR